MRTFIIRARKGTTQWQQFRANVGTNEHVEIIAHSIINAFFVSKDFRQDVEVYIVLDSAPDFPRTIKLASHEGLSLSGFHEDAIITAIEQALKNSQALQKDGCQSIAPGIAVYGFGFEKLVSQFLGSRPVYLLDPKGDNIRTVAFDNDPVFVLSDHIPMPKNIIKSFSRRGMKAISLGRKMLFASQCIVLINHEIDLQGY